MDGRHAPADADGFRQRLQREPRHCRAQARHQRLGHGDSRASNRRPARAGCRAGWCRKPSSLDACRSRAGCCWCRPRCRRRPAPDRGRPPRRTSGARGSRSGRAGATVATPALTLPAPDSTNTASRPAISPRQKAKPPISCAWPERSLRWANSSGRADMTPKSLFCHGRMGYKVAAAEATDRMPPALPLPSRAARRLQRLRPRPPRARSCASMPATSASAPRPTRAR